MVEKSNSGVFCRLMASPPSRFPVVQNVSCLLVCEMICIGGMVTGLWNGGMVECTAWLGEGMTLALENENWYEWWNG